MTKKTNKTNGFGFTDVAAIVGGFAFGYLFGLIGIAIVFAGYYGYKFITKKGK